MPEHIRLRRGDLEPSAFLGIQQRGKDGGRIEARKAHEVNRAVHADQRGGMQVSNDTVVLDWLRIHESTLSQLAGSCNER